MVSHPDLLTFNNLISEMEIGRSEMVMQDSQESGQESDEDDT